MTSTKAEAEDLEDWEPPVEVECPASVRVVWTLTPAWEMETW